MVPVRDVPRTAASPLKCGPHIAPSVPKKKGKPHNKPFREGGRAPEAQQKSPPRLRTRFSLCVFTFVWGCHTESPANSFAGSQPSQPATDGKGKRPPWGPLPVLGLVPVKVERAAPVRPSRGRITTSKKRPSISHDLEHDALLRSERIGLVPLPTAIQILGVNVKLKLKSNTSSTK